LTVPEIAPVDPAWANALPISEKVTRRNKNNLTNPVEILFALVVTVRILSLTKIGKGEPFETGELVSSYGGESQLTCPAPSSHKFRKNLRI